MKFQINKKDITLLAAFALFLIVIAPYMYSTDIGFYIIQGRYALNNGFPNWPVGTSHTDWAYTMNHCIPSVITALMNIVMDVRLLQKVYVKIFYAIITALLMWAIYRQRKDAAFTAIVTSLCLLSFYPYANIARGFSFTIIALIFLTSILVDYKEGIHNRLWVLPILSMMEINHHAAMWPMLILFTIPFWIPEKIVTPFKKIVSTTHYNRMNVFLWTLSMIPAGFINPYGPKQELYLFISNDMEWFNKVVLECYHEYPITLVKLIFVIIVIIVVPLFNHKRPSFESLCLLTGCLIMDIMMVRNRPLFGLAFFEAMIETSNIPLKEKDTNPYYSETNKLAIICWIMSFVTITGLMAKDLDRKGLHLSDIKHFDYTEESLQAKEWDILFKQMKTAKKYYKDGMTVMNEYENGPFMILHGITPFVDARAEIYMKKFNKKEDLLYEWTDMTEYGSYDDYGKQKEIQRKFMKKYDPDMYIGYDTMYLSRCFTKNKDYKVVWKKTLKSNGFRKDYIIAVKKE